MSEIMRNQNIQVNCDQLSKVYPVIGQLEIKTPIVESILDQNQPSAWDHMQFGRKKNHCRT